MVTTIQIRLDNVERVKAFIRVIDHYRLRMWLRSGHVCVNPHSILGIFSLNPSCPLNLEIDRQDEEISTMNRLLSDIRTFCLSQCERKAPAEDE